MSGDYTCKVYAHIRELVAVVGEGWGGIQGRKYFGTITIRQLFSQNKYLKCNLKCKEVGGCPAQKTDFLI